MLYSTVSVGEDTRITPDKSSRFFRKLFLKCKVINFGQQLIISRRKYVIALLLTPKLRNLGNVVFVRNGSKDGVRLPLKSSIVSDAFNGVILGTASNLLRSNLMDLKRVKPQK